MVVSDADDEPNFADDLSTCSYFMDDADSIFADSGDEDEPEAVSASDDDDADEEAASDLASD